MLYGIILYFYVILLKKKQLRKNLKIICYSKNVKFNKNKVKEFKKSIYLIEKCKKIHVFMINILRF